MTLDKYQSLEGKTKLEIMLIKQYKAVCRINKQIRNSELTDWEKDNFMLVLLPLQAELFYKVYKIQ